MPVAGFGSQIQTDDGAQRIYKNISPLLFIACTVFSLYISIAHTENALRNSAAIIFGCADLCKSSFSDTGRSV